MGCVNKDWLIDLFCPFVWLHTVFSLGFHASNLFFSALENAIFIAKTEDTLCPKFYDLYNWFLLRFLFINLPLTLYLFICAF